MDIVLKHSLIETSSLKSYCISFLPGPKGPHHNAVAIFSHGYTASKSDLLSWASRLAKQGVATIIFDWPGHYLGGQLEFPSFEIFKAQAFRLYEQAYKKLAQEISFIPEKCFIGGHSLGGILAFPAIKTPFFSVMNTSLIAVGLGDSKKETHLLQSSFYKSTLNLRSQLVSKNLSPELVFSWIKKMKQDIDLTGRRLHIITGQDDLVSREGLFSLIDRLTQLGNVVTLENPAKLAHHEPEKAAGFVKKFILSQLEINGKVFK